MVILWPEQVDKLSVILVMHCNVQMGGGRGGREVMFAHIYAQIYVAKCYLIHVHVQENGRRTILRQY